MKQYGKICLAIFLTLLLTSSGLAFQGFDVDITAIDDNVNPTQSESASFSISVKNRMDSRKTFRIGYSTGTASSPAWYYMDNSILSLEPNETKTSILYVTPDEAAVAGNRGPEIYVYPTEDSSNRFSRFITFTINRDREIILTDFRSPDASYDPSEEVRTSVVIKNVVQKDVSANFYQTVFSIGGRTVTKSVPGIDSGEDGLVSADIPLEGFEAGVYDMEVEVREVETGKTVLRRTAKVKVNEYSDYETSMSSNKSLMGNSNVISVVNTGNVEIDGLNLTSSFSWYETPFISFIQKPDHSLKNGGVKTFYWTVKNLEPGERRSIRYSKSYLSGLVVLLIVGIVFYIVYSQLHSVTVVKFVKKKKDSHSVNVRIRNKTGRKVKKVKVEDFVPGIASLINDFDSRSPDKIQKTDEGTRIVWEVEEMEPGEERIFMYRIKPRIRVEGTVNLPETDVEYLAKGKKFSEKSHSVSTDFR